MFRIAPLFHATELTTMVLASHRAARSVDA